MFSLTTTKPANERLRERVVEAVRQHGPVSRKAIVGLCERYVPPEVAARYAATDQALARSGARIKIHRVISDLRRGGHIVQSDPGGKSGPLYVIANKHQLPT